MNIVTECCWKIIRKNDQENDFCKIIENQVLLKLIHHFKISINNEQNNFAFFLQKHLFSIVMKSVLIEYKSYNESFNSQQTALTFSTKEAKNHVTMRVYYCNLDYIGWKKVNTDNIKGVYREGN